MRYRTTGQKIPVFPKELLEGRTSPQRGKFPLAAGFIGTKKAGVRPRAIPTPAAGTLRPLIVLLDFADKPHNNVDHPASAYTPLFFGSGASDHSVANYWNEVSYGTFTLTGSSADIIGWIRPSAAPSVTGEFLSTITSYVQITDPLTGVNLTNLRTLVADIVAYLDGASNNLDFTPYADPATGIVKSMILVHAGTGQEDSGNTADLYSHSASLTSPSGTNDTDINGHQVTVADYCIVPEELSFDPATGLPSPALIGPGVIVHEMGHLFGLPDLYPTSQTAGLTGNAFSGVGVFDLMGYGLWGSNLLARPDVPAHLSAWSKSELGWIVPTVLSATSSRTLLPAESSASAYKVYPNGPGDESQYFLIELRGKDSAGLFDRYLPGNGVLIWRVDAEQMSGRRGANTVNNDSAFPALSVQEADLTGASPTPHMRQPFSIGAAAFGVAGDFFSTSGQVFSRLLPVDGQNLTNSSPTVNTSSANHLFDSGFYVSIRNFIVSIVTNIVNAVFDLAVELPYWKVYRSTDAQPTLNSNKTLSYGFDGSNRTWVGTADQGIWIFGLTTWAQINSSLLRSPRIQAMAYDPSTGSMWVGTDLSIAKVRLDQVRSDEVFPLLPSTINVKGIRIARDLTKWFGGARQLAIITDVGNNLPSDLAYADMFFVFNDDPLQSTEQITCMEFDNVFSTDRAMDILYIGTSAGNIYRNFRESDSEVLSLYSTNLSFLRFRKMTALSNALNRPGAINAMAIDKAGLLWVATDRGVFAFDRGDPSSSDPNVRADRYNPFDLAGDNTLTSLVYFPPSFTNPPSGSIQPTGIAFQDTGQQRSIVWVSYGDTVGATESGLGGAERIDPNVLMNTRIPKDSGAGIDAIDQDRIGHATMKFISAVDPKNGPAVNDLIGAGGDGSSNIWFATKNSGAVRFGSGASLSLDRITYINEPTVANVALVDENSSAPTLVVQVTGTSDGIGFALTLSKGTDNVYRGRFGFSLTATDSARNPKVILIKSLDTVTVTYRDTNPPSTKSASATWKKEVPFHDSLLIEGCFIATAAYGSAMDPEVRTLRRFRDAWLLTNPGGRAFTAIYYRMSPPLAEWIARRPALRLAARYCLVPAVLLAEVALGTAPVEKIASMCIILLIPGLLVFFSRNNTGQARIR